MSVGGFLSRWLFGGAEAPPVRLDHPRDLRAGDILKLGFLPQPELNGSTFEITQVNTYIYGDLCYPELVLKDRKGNIVFLMVEEEDGEEYLAFSRKVARSDVWHLLDQQQLDSIVTARGGERIHLRDKLHGMEEWLADEYRKSSDKIVGRFLRGDAREMDDEEIQHTEGFVSHILVNDKDTHALEIEIYDSGELELSLTVYHELSAIEEMWPGKGEA